MRILGVVSSSSRERPNAPTIGTATDVGTGRAFNNGAATITFTAPTWNGGLPITSYTATSSPGGFTGTAASSPITVAGLQSNTNYTFTVTATNGAGTSVASSASNSILATTIPQAPTIGTATAGNTSATVAYTANATGGKTVTYTATSSPGSFTGTGASPITVSGLTNGTPYTFTVTATNANGSATSAASNSVTPVSPYLSFFSSINVIGDGFKSHVNSNAVYYLGYISGTTGTTIFSYSKTGTLNWQKLIAPPSGATQTLFGLTSDSSGNLYVSGQIISSGVQDVYVAKLTSSGTFTWQKRISDTNMTSASSNDLKLDSSGNVYVVIQSANGPHMAKLSATDGSVSWLRSVPSSYTNYAYTSVSVLANGGIQGVWPLYQTIGKDIAYRGYTATINSSGTRTNGNAFGDSTSGGQIAPWGGVTSDSSSNIYIAGAKTVSFNLYAHLAKYNSSLVRQASVYLTQGVYRWSAIDSSANIYTVGISYASPRQFIIAKWNSSLTLQWQRFLNVTPGNTSGIQGLGISVDETASRIAVSGSNDYKLFTCFIPMDGSGTGTYTVGSYTVSYSASSASVVSTTDNNAINTSGTQQTRTPTVTAPVSTSSTSSYTVTTTTF